ncbi:MAG: tRNA (adenosine(37)-N6)-threonylcarbamoyltransferase complex dimerization subunit type 1 TsaB [Cyanobacteriota bacterium]
MSSSEEGAWLLALHSSTETLGLGLQRLGLPQEQSQLATFPLGRALSNQLFSCLESLLPAGQWSRLGRLAVATGPGGFTGTRLTVVLARTLAQQLRLPLEGISSFQLAARRLLVAGGLGLGGRGTAPGPFWLVQELPRHGLVAGLYEADPAALAGLAERRPPRLFRTAAALEAEERALGCPGAPRAAAEPLLPADVEQLLVFGQAAAAACLASPWQPVLPLYPTSPVEGG